MGEPQGTLLLRGEGVPRRPQCSEDFQRPAAQPAACRWRAMLATRFQGDVSVSPRRCNSRPEAAQRRRGPAINSPRSTPRGGLLRPRPRVYEKAARLNSRSARLVPPPPGATRSGGHAGPRPLSQGSCPQGPEPPQLLCSYRASPPPAAAGTLPGAPPFTPPAVSPATFPATGPTGHRARAKYSLWPPSSRSLAPTVGPDQAASVRSHPPQHPHPGARLTSLQPAARPGPPPAPEPSRAP